MASHIILTSRECSARWFRLLTIGYIVQIRLDIGMSGLRTARMQLL